jgi:tetratricopeptide (TPR) repeat protein
MRRIRVYFLVTWTLLLVCTGLDAQVDRREVRSGNRQFRKENWQKAEIDYRRAQVKDSLSFAAGYNLASVLYRQDNFDEAGKQLEPLQEVAAALPEGADYFYNLGNIAVRKKDWQSAVEAYKQSLLRNPGDLDAKENYIYARLMLENEGGGGGGGEDQENQDRNDRNNRNDQNQDQQDEEQQPRPQQSQGETSLSPQQAQQMLNAIQAKEKETQDKVNKEKAALLKSRQKEKNW